MCLILCGYETHPRYRLVIAANRDEFRARPTAPASWWDDAPGLLAGRDLEKGGTWLGLTRRGRFAAVTNYREPAVERADAPSRGSLVRDFLESRGEVESYLAGLMSAGAQYNGYNLLIADGGRLAYHSNRGGEPMLLAPGIYGISNHLLDTPWPKVLRGKARFAGLLERHDDSLPTDELFTLLADSTPAPDEELPETGLPIELERMVSPIFTVGEEYGTRCSTVVTVSREGEVYFEERDALDGRRSCYRFMIKPAAA